MVEPINKALKRNGLFLWDAIKRNDVAKI